jgi:heme exporter protein D
MNHWHTLGDFLSMGGHGLYVWGAYGTAALLMAIEAVAAAARWRRALRCARDDAGDGAPR